MGPMLFDFKTGSQGLQKNRKRPFFGSHTTKTVDKSSTTTFLESLEKFGLKCFAPPRICLLLHLFVKRSTMVQQRLGTLALLRIESNLVQKLT